MAGAIKVPFTCFLSVVLDTLKGEEGKQHAFPYTTMAELIRRKTSAVNMTLLRNADNNAHVSPVSLFCCCVCQLFKKFHMDVGQAKIR